MTDRHAGYIVTLAENLRDDAAEPTLTALRMVSGVVSVVPVVDDYRMAIARERRDMAWRAALRDLAIPQ